MDAKAREKLASGVLGRFWLMSDPVDKSKELQERDALSGKVQFTEDAVQVTVQERTTDDDPESSAFETLTALSSGALPSPDWIFGLTEIGAVLIPVVTRTSARSNFGGTQISTRTFHGPSIGIGIQDRFGPTVWRMSTTLPCPSWAGLEPMKQLVHRPSADDPVAVHLQLRNTPVLQCGHVGNINVSLYGSWRQSQDAQNHTTTVRTGLTIETEIDTPVKVQDHVDIILAVQDLVSLSYDSFMASYDGHCMFEGSLPSGLRTWFYHRDFAQPESPVRPSTPQSLPLFDLQTLGDHETVSRWVSLTNRFPDAANAVRVRHRAHLTPTRRMVELGAAIEQYVVECKKTSRDQGKLAKWTLTSKERPHSVALAKRAGPRFAQFVGDATLWGKTFHAAYIAEKHNTGSRRPPAELLVINQSAQILMILTLLDRAAGSRAASSQVLKDHRITPLGERVKALLGT